MANEYLTYFAFARTALKYGLNVLKFHVGDGILVPDYICDVVWHPMQQVGLKVFAYPLTNALVPDWKAINATLLNESVSALLMVHYFGQPQNMEYYRAFCDENNLWLVEDNAHGHGGLFGGQPLGTFGDIGISSPRKILGLESGGVLYCKCDDAVQLGKARALRPYPSAYLFQMLKTWLSCFPKIKGRLRGMRNIAKNWSDPLAFHERQQPDCRIDPCSRRRIASVDWQGIAARRRDAWDAWAAFTRVYGLEPVFSDVHPESCPWAIPVYAHDLVERDHWLRWGAKHGFSVFPWPSLPKEIIDQNGSALARWQRLLCFSLDQFPKVSQ